MKGMRTGTEKLGTTGLENVTVRRHRESSAGGHPSQVLLRLSLSLGILAGFSLGLILLLTQETGSASVLPWTALTQIHGQIQIVGFAGLFILGTAAQLLPGFLSSPIENRTRIVTGGALVAIGLLLRATFQISEPSVLRSATLGISALGEFIGVALCLWEYGQLARRSIQPRDQWQMIVAAGFGFLLLSLVLNGVAVTTLMRGSKVVPWNLDAAIVQLELWGFIVCMVFGVSRKILPRFLLLPAPNNHGLGMGVLSYVAGVALVASGWLSLAVSLAPPIGSDLQSAGALLQMAGVVAVVWNLRLFYRPTRPSSAPAVTEPFRRWVIIAFGWLLIANALPAIWALRVSLGGIEPSFFEITAERHALAQGFLLSIIVAYGARILPGYSAWAIRHPRLSEVTFACVTIGALLRVIGELGTGSALPFAAIAAAGGGTVGTIGFLLFSIPLLVVDPRPAPLAKVRPSEKDKSENRPG